jgi:hypothetical protein
MKIFGFDIVNQRGEDEYVLFEGNDINTATKEFKKKYRPYWIKRVMRVDSIATMEDNF